LGELPISLISGVVPGKHTTRKGWLTKDFHYPQSPYTSDVDARIWTLQHGVKKSLREIGAETAWFFRKSIRAYSDPFSFRLLFAILSGRAPSMLDLVDRPAAYEDVGRLCRWGMMIHELKNFDAELSFMRSKNMWLGQTIDEAPVSPAQARRSTNQRRSRSVRMPPASRLRTDFSKTARNYPTRRSSSASSTPSMLMSA